MRSVRPLGMYQARRSFLHGIDARVKLGCLILLSIGTFAASLPWGLALAVIACIATSCTARFSAVSLLRALRPALIILLLAFVANALRLDGSGDIALMGALSLSSEGMVRATVALLRIIIVVAYVCAVSATTSIQQVADAISALLKPLGRLGALSASSPLVISVALRFIPEVAGEFERIESAQKARGAHFDGGPIRRLRAYAAVLVPLVDALFRRSDDLARALQMRCYASGAMTDMTASLRARDWMMLVLAAVAMVAMICL